MTRENQVKGSVKRSELKVWSCFLGAATLTVASGIAIGLSAMWPLMLRGKVSTFCNNSTTDICSKFSYNGQTGQAAYLKSYQYVSFLYSLYPQLVIHGLYYVVPSLACFITPLYDPMSNKCHHSSLVRAETWIPVSIYIVCSYFVSAIVQGIKFSDAVTRGFSELTSSQIDELNSFSKGMAKSYWALSLTTSLIIPIVALVTVLLIKKRCAVNKELNENSALLKEVKVEADPKKKEKIK